MRSVTCGGWLLALACSLAPSGVAAQERFFDRFSLRVEAAAATMVSTYQRNDDASQYDGNAKAYRIGGFQGALRVGFRLFDPLIIQASLANWVFPSSLHGPTGWVFAPMGGVRFEPRVGSAGRVFLDANIGAAYTGRERRTAVDVALGFEFDLTRALALGPVIRYGQTIQPDTLADGTPEPHPDDARYLSAGVSLTLHPPSEVAPPSVPPTALPTPTPRPNDHDGDAVLDPDDHCPSTPAGTHPDPTRPGCPQTDTDGDGIFDGQDRCPVLAAGPTPNPEMPGCPDPDNDGDGVTDHTDQCRDRARGPYPDPARPGCPEPDEDGDGRPNSVDRCPDRPETYNNFEDGDGCPDRAPLVTIGEGVIRILGTINFATGSNQLIGSRSFDICDSLVAILAAHTEIARVEVQGHTDDRGTAEYNRDLSQRRAETVRQYLVDHGIAPERVVARGYGLARPRVPNSDRNHRAANRRVEVHILGANESLASQ